MPTVEPWMYAHEDDSKRAVAHRPGEGPANRDLRGLQSRAGNRAVGRLLRAGGLVVQRRGPRGKGALAMKDKGDAKRIDGPFWQLEARVDEVIEANNVKNMKKTSVDLKRSITARTEDAKRHDPGTPQARSHAHRVQQESGLLTRLQEAITAAEADTDGWQTA